VRILFDTNILLDVFLEREPFVEASTTLFDANVRGVVDGLLGATTVTTTYYLATKKKDRGRARDHVHELLRLFEVAPVNRQVLAQAVESDFQDYEDAVLHSAAQASGADGIVTRNEGDFDPASLSVHTPEELLAILDLRTE
jgi:predicted nucleic acid-binding protein